MIVGASLYFLYQKYYPGFIKKVYGVDISNRPFSKKAMNTRIGLPIFLLILFSASLWGLYSGHVKNSIKLNYPTFINFDRFTPESPRFKQYEKSFNIKNTKILAVYVPKTQSSWDISKINQLMLIVTSIKPIKLPTLDQWLKYKTRAVQKGQRDLKKQIEEKNPAPNATQILGIFTPFTESYSFLHSQMSKVHFADHLVRMGSETTAIYVNGNVIGYVVTREIQNNDQINWLKNVSIKATKDILTLNPQGQVPASIPTLQGFVDKALEFISLSLLILAIIFFLIGYGLIFLIWKAFFKKKAPSEPTKPKDQSVIRT
jgi:hypothetical protein